MQPTWLRLFDSFFIIHRRQMFVLIAILICNRSSCTYLTLPSTVDRRQMFILIAILICNRISCTYLTLSSTIDRRQMFIRFSPRCLAVGCSCTNLILSSVGTWAVIARIFVDLLALLSSYPHLKHGWHYSLHAHTLSMGFTIISPSSVRRQMIQPELLLHLVLSHPSRGRWYNRSYSSSLRYVITRIKQVSSDRVNCSTFLLSQTRMRVVTLTLYQCSNLLLS